MRMRNRARAAAAATVVAVSVGLAGPALASSPEPPKPTPSNAEKTAKTAPAKGWATMPFDTLKAQLNKVFDKRATGLDKVLARVAANEKLPAATKEKLTAKVNERKASLAKAKDAVAKARSVDGLRQAVRDTHPGRKGSAGVARSDAADMKKALRVGLGKHEVRPGKAFRQGDSKPGKRSGPGDVAQRKSFSKSDGTPRVGDGSGDVRPGKRFAERALKLRERAAGNHAGKPDVRPDVKPDKNGVTAR